MTIQEEIISLIGKFDYTWYAGINKMFVAEKGYDHITKRIKTIIPDHYYGYDPETFKEHVEGKPIDCCIEEYAWNYDFENNVFEEDNLPIQAKYISKNIEGIITAHINERQDVIQQDQFITNVLAVVLGKLNGFTKANVDAEYASILFHFYRLLKSRISHDHSHIRRSADKQRSFMVFIKSAIIVPAQDTNYGTSKPTFKEKAILEIYDILTEYFEEAEHLELLRILKTGETVTVKLHFQDDGNRLADMFKRLYAAGVITNCEKRELQIWVMNNFTYRHRGKINEFKPHYLEDIISAGSSKCKKPIIEFKKDPKTGQYSMTKS